MDMNNLPLHLYHEELKETEVTLFDFMASISPKGHETWLPIVVVATNGAGGFRTHVQTISTNNSIALCYI